MVQSLSFKCFHQASKHDISESMAKTSASASPKDLITDDEVKKVLLADKGEEALLTTWKIIDFMKPGENYSRYVTSILVNYSINKQESEVSYVAKANPCKPFDESASHLRRATRVETMFFQDLIPEMNSALESAGQKPLQFPKCYHANLEPGKEVIYFEDLRTKQFKMNDKKIGLDYYHTSLALTELARCHAAWKLLQDNYSREKLEQKFSLLLEDDEKVQLPRIPVMEGNFTFTINVLKKFGKNEKAMQWIESKKPQIKEIITKGTQSEKFEAICHGDCWNNNMLFRYGDDGKPVEVMLLDLEVSYKASLGVDINYLLYTSVTGDVRRSNMDHFFQTYYSNYKKIVEAAGLTMHFTQDELVKEFRHKNVVGAAYAMLVLPAIFAESIHMPDMSEFEGDLEKYCNEFRARLLESMTDHPLTEPRLLAMFDEFIENGLIS